MSTNSQDQEIDLGQIGTGIKNFFSGIVNSIFDFIFFVKKKIVIIGSLFVIGVVAAFVLDPKVYNHEISVIPNFGSNEYLYKKIEGDALAVTFYASYWWVYFDKYWESTVAFHVVGHC